jgi:phosphoglycolate phosphatase
VPVKVIVFDWDGTLVDSEAHIVSCLTFAAAQQSLPQLGYDRYKSIIGLGMHEALLALYPDLNEHQLVAMRESYSAHFTRSTKNETQLFKGVRDTLEALTKKGIRLAVATGKSRRGLERAKQVTKLGHYFEQERCADETKSKPNPLMLQELQHYFDVAFDEMLMVGDTSFDMEMAYNAGIPSVGVSYGVHDPKTFMQWQPQAIVDNLSDLLTLSHL